MKKQMTGTKSLKKVGCLLMAAAIALTGCGSSAETKPAETKAETASESKAEPEAESKTETAAEQPSGDPVYINADADSLTGTVRFWTAFDGQYGTQAMIDEFKEHYPNVNVEYTVYKNSTEGNVTADMALISGDIDVILSFGTHNTAARWANGQLMDITDRMAADNLDLKKEWGTDAYRYNDRTYCFPSGGLSVFVAVNMDMWNAAGLGELPEEWTWDEYLEACRKMTQRDSSGATTVYGGTDFNQRDYWTYQMRQTKGVDAFYNAEGKADFDSGLAATILNRELSAEEEGIFYKKINLITDGTRSRDLLWNGTVGSCVESIITRFVMDKENCPHDFLLGYAPYPINAAGETNYALGNMPNSFVCVSQNAQDADAAYAFAKFAATSGSKYMFKAGHTSTWTGIDPDEIVDLVFGSAETAAEYVDVDSYIANVLAVGAPAYHEENITAYSEIASLVDEYTDYILSGEMPVEAGLADLNQLANEAIEAAGQ